MIPFVPLDGGTMEQCVDAAHRAGQEIWNRFRVPVYFYESAARIAGRKRLELVRRPGFDGLPPDVGDIAAHPTAGAAVVGARGFLIAFNINLATRDVEIARSVAQEDSRIVGRIPIRQSDRPRPRIARLRSGVHAISSTLRKLRSTKSGQQWSRKPRGSDTSVASSQLIGFVPQRAFEQAPEFFQRAENFDESRILETRIAELLK